MSILEIPPQSGAHRRALAFIALALAFGAVLIVPLALLDDADRAPAVVTCKLPLPAPAPPPSADTGEIVDVIPELLRGRRALASTGGVAWQAAAHKRARFFRLDADDRAGPGSAAVYFEDPYAPLDSPALPMNLASTGPLPRAWIVRDGDDAVNPAASLSFDTHHALAFVVDAGSEDGRALIVVYGNVTIADDIIVSRGKLDIVALKRADGSGGFITIGDGTFRTLRRIDARIAAETAIEWLPHATHVQPQQATVEDVIGPRFFARR